MVVSRSNKLIKRSINVIRLDLAQRRYALQIFFLSWLWKWVQEIFMQLIFFHVECVLQNSVARWSMHFLHLCASVLSCAFFLTWPCCSTHRQHFQPKKNPKLYKKKMGNKNNIISSYVIFECSSSF